MKFMFSRNDIFPVVSLITFIYISPATKTSNEDEKEKMNLLRKFYIVAHRTPALRRFG